MSEEAFSPWRSMWTSPRKTIQRIASHAPSRSIWTLSFIYGVTSLLNASQSIPIALQIGLLPTILLALLLAPLWGYAVMSFWSYAVFWVGKLFKGEANFKTARAAYAWSCVPLVGNLPIWAVLILFYGPMLFFGIHGQVLLSNLAMTVLFIAISGKLVFSVWSLVLYLIALSEVQNFSIWRSIGTTLVTAIILGVLFWALALCLGMGGPSLASLELQDASSIAHYLK